MLVTPLGIVTLVRTALLKNAKSAMAVTGLPTMESGRVTAPVKPV